VTSSWNQHKREEATAAARSDDEETQTPTEYPDFPEFDKQISGALDELNHKVFIKLNWSSPKDAAWSLNKLHCQRISDVYILLKSSDFVTHDLSEAFAHCSDRAEASELVSNFKYYLVVREWINMNPSMEFRCFVYKNRLIGFYSIFPYFATICYI
jgi:hypothetical protein